MDTVLHVYTRKLHGVICFRCPQLCGHMQWPIMCMSVPHKPVSVMSSAPGSLRNDLSLHDVLLRVAGVTSVGVSLVRGEQF